MNQTPSTLKPLQGTNIESLDVPIDEPGNVSLVTRAGMVISIIVALVLLSMMASMLVSESLDGDAAHINMAGALRMQSIRLSRALTAQQNQLIIQNDAGVASEVSEFDQRLMQLESALGKQLEGKEIASIHANLTGQWSSIKRAISKTPQQFRNEYAMIDEFVGTIDELVSALQHHSEGTVRVLRIIQSSSMFLILLTAFVSLQGMTKWIVQPMNQLVRAAQEAGKGNFSIRTNDAAKNEIGVLARSFNTMSEQLQNMHDRFEHRVQEKTSQLKQSNKSLELLYQISHNLVRPKHDKDYRHLLKQVEENMGNGTLTLCLNSERSREALNWMSPISNHDLPKICGKNENSCQTCLQANGQKYNFSIQKRDDEFGVLSYNNPEHDELEQWQAQLLQTIADNIAIAISLDKKRLQQNLIGLQEERAVIARELHDSLAQSLSYLKLQTSLLAKQLDSAAPRKRIDNTITDIRSGLSDAYRQLRELLTTFRLSISDATLETALKSTAIEFTQKCSHEVQLDCQIDTTLLSPNEQIHVLQIVREALSNIQRHAHASEACIVLSQRENRTHVRISDNGIGLSSSIGTSHTDSHHGMNIMHERAESLNARLSIDTKQDGGTDVVIEFMANSQKIRTVPKVSKTENGEVE